METTDATDGGQAPAVDPAAGQVTLDEFCVRLSQNDKRVELIGGFYFVEKQASRFKDAESNYQARFTAFVNKPV